MEFVKKLEKTNPDGEGLVGLGRSWNLSEVGMEPRRDICFVDGGNSLETFCPETTHCVKTSALQIISTAESI